MKNFIQKICHSKDNKLAEVIRFGIVGGIATAIQYGVYLLALTFVHHNWAHTIGYTVSFLFNFIASTYFTFKVHANVQRGIGFAFSHLINYFLQIVTLNIFMQWGISKQWAPLPMFAVCIPINFLLVRFFIKR